MPNRTISGGSAKRYKDLVTLLGLKNDKMSIAKAQDIQRRLEIMGIDGESAVALFQAYEEKGFRSGQHNPKRLENFSQFISKYKDKNSLLENATDLGMLSTDALENYAQETGNWMPLMVRREVLKKLQPEVKEEVKQNG